MDFTGKETDEDDFLYDSPGILIPCEDLKSLKQLILLLYRKHIFDGDSAFLLKNVPDDIFNILNNDMYFEEVEVIGIKMVRGQLLGLEIPTEELL